MPVIAGHEVGRIGYGLMGLTWRANPQPQEDSFETMRAALAANCNFWNGGEFYGNPDNNSLTLLKNYYEKYPEDAKKVVLNIKGAVRPGHGPDGSAAFVRQSVESCLKMLGNVGKIDMFECARRDINTPLEETLGELAKLVHEGKIGGVALSEVNANTIREASKITKIVGVEVELSLWATEPLTNGIAAACAELDIPLIAYSPVGRGMLTGQIKTLDDLPKDDARRHFPRFQPENFDINIKLAKELEKIAEKRNVTPAQLAIGWLLTLSKQPGMPVIIPIPGTTTVERVKENSVVVELSNEEMKEIDSILAQFEVVGDRYPAAHQKFVNA